MAKDVFMPNPELTARCESSITGHVFKTLSGQSWKCMCGHETYFAYCVRCGKIADERISGQQALLAHTPPKKD